MPLNIVKNFNSPLAAILLLFLLSACYPWMKRIDIEQGNVVEQQQLDKLKSGMSREQVRFLLGNSLVDDQFNLNTWTYYFYLRDDRDIRTTYLVSVHFAENGYTSYDIAGDFFDITSSKRYQSINGAE